LKKNSYICGNEFLKSYMGNVKVLDNLIITELDTFTAIITNNYTLHRPADFLHHFPFFTETN
jgi:hypothetical protein